MLGGSLNGNSVLLPTLATEPQGAVLSVWAAQVRSGGHQKAAGPMVSDGPSPMALAAGNRSSRAWRAIMVSVGACNAVACWGCL